MPSTLISIPPGDLPQFDELYAVSDLHMGGLPDFQIFDAGQELASLVDHVRTLEAARVAFVINGDMVDFLAEGDAKPFDPGGARRRSWRASPVRRTRSSRLGRRSGGSSAPRDAT